MEGGKKDRERNIDERETHRLDATQTRPDQGQNSNLGSFSPRVSQHSNHWTKLARAVLDLIK